MSSKLKPLDLTSQAIGFSGTIDFSQFMKFDPMNLQNAANIWLFNESGAGLDIKFLQSGNAHYLPAGGWGFFAVAPNDAQVQATITYLLPNPPVSQLNAIYYAPGEPLPQSFTLGNSPIGIGGTVNTSGVNTLSNESNAANTLVVDVGTSGNNNLLDIFNDHFIWKVLQGINPHTVLQGQSAGNPLLIGQAGDISEVLGKLTVDQLLTAAAGLSISANGLSVVGGETTDTLSVTGTSTLTGDATFNGKVVASPTVNTVNGSSGSISIFIPIWGAGLKIMLLLYNSFANTSVLSFNFPSAMSGGLYFTGNRASGTQTSSLFKGGLQQNVRSLSALGGSGAGSSTTETNILTNQLVQFFTGADQIQWNFGASTVSCFEFIIGF